MLNDTVLTPPEPSAKNGGKILEPSHLSFRLFRVRTCVRKMALEKDAYNISFQFWFFATLHFEKKKIVSYRSNKLTLRNDKKTSVFHSLMNVLDRDMKHSAPFGRHVTSNLLQDQVKVFNDDRYSHWLQNEFVYFSLCRLKYKFYQTKLPCSFSFSQQTTPEYSQGNTFFEDSISARSYACIMK